MYLFIIKLLDRYFHKHQALIKVIGQKKSNMESNFHVNTVKELRSYLKERGVVFADLNKTS